MTQIPTVALTFRDDGIPRSMLAMSFNIPAAISLSSLASLLIRVAWFSKDFTRPDILSYLYVIKADSKGRPHWPTEDGRLSEKSSNSRGFQPPDQFFHFVLLVHESSDQSQTLLRVTQGVVGASLHCVGLRLMPAGRTQRHEGDGEDTKIERGGRFSLRP